MNHCTNYYTANVSICHSICWQKIFAQHMFSQTIECSLTNMCFHEHHDTFKTYLFRSAASISTTSAIM